MFSRHSCVPQLLRIENFRCFESIEIHFSPGINFLIGAGGSGKSSVIEAIHLLLSDISGQFETKYLYNSLRNTEKPAVIQLTANIFVSHEILDATEALSIPKAIRDALINEKGTALTLKLIIEKTGTYTYHVNDLPLEEHWLSNWKSLLSGETFFSGVQKKNSIGSLKSIFMSDRSSEGRYQALLELLGYSEVVKKFTDIETRANELQITEQDIEARINNGKLIETQLEMGAGHFSELQGLREEIESLNLEETWAPVHQLENRVFGLRKGLQAMSEQQESAKVEIQDREGEKARINIELSKLQERKELLSKQFEERRKLFLEQKARQDRVEQRIGTWERATKRIKQEQRQTQMKLGDAQRRLDSLKYEDSKEDLRKELENDKNRLFETLQALNEQENASIRERSQQKSDSSAKEREVKDFASIVESERSSLKEIEELLRIKSLEQAQAHSQLEIAVEKLELLLEREATANKELEAAQRELAAHIRKYKLKDSLRPPVIRSSSTIYTLKAKIQSKLQKTIKDGIDESILTRLREHREFSTGFIKEMGLIDQRRLLLQKQAQNLANEWNNVLHASLVSITNTVSALLKEWSITVKAGLRDVRGPIEGALDIRLSKDGKNCNYESLNSSVQFICDVFWEFSILSLKKQGFLINDGGMNALDYNDLLKVAKTLSSSPQSIIGETSVVLLLALQSIPEEVHILDPISVIELVAL